MARRAVRLAPWTRGRTRWPSEGVKEPYDRAGTAVDGGVGEVIRGVVDGTAATLRLGRSASAARRAADSAERNHAPANRAAGGAYDTLSRVTKERPIRAVSSAGGDPPNRARERSGPDRVRGLGIGRDRAYNGQTGAMLYHCSTIELPKFLHSDEE